MNFTDAVLETPEIAECLKAGLQALGSNSDKIEVKSTGSLEGSVDIDTCLKTLYPDDTRWDYVFGYKDRLYYVEVHQGKTSEIKKVIAKLKWLMEWRQATELEALKGRSTYHWISTKGTDTFAKGSRYSRILTQNGIRGPSSRLRTEP